MRIYQAVKYQPPSSSTPLPLPHRVIWFIPVDSELRLWTKDSSHASTCYYYVIVNHLLRIQGIAKLILATLFAQTDLCTICRIIDYLDKMFTALSSVDSQSSRATNSGKQGEYCRCWLEGKWIFRESYSIDSSLQTYSLLRIFTIINDLWSIYFTIFICN